MRPVTAGEVAAWANGRLLGDPGVLAEAFSADSRTITSLTAFAAVRSGHDYVTQAVASGAPFVLVERDDAVPAGSTAVVCEDVIAALGRVAAKVRAEAGYTVVGVTGSYGKTLTKDFLAAAMSTTFRTHATPASYNAELGVPLVLLSSPPDAEILVCELGARRPGEIASLSRMVRPHVGVLTGVGVTHLELFGHRRALAGTKAELLQSLPADGLGVIPADDDFLSLHSASCAAPLVTVGGGGTIGYATTGIDQRGRTHGWIRLGGRTVEVVLPVGGRALMRNAALAMATAAELGVDPATAAAAIGHSRPSAWRMQVLEVVGRTIVNDAYNANPTSTASALRTVAEMARPAHPRDGRQMWAVLGEMAELGDLAQAAHRRIGRLVATLGYAGVVAVGRSATEIAEGAGSMAHQVGSVEEAAEVVDDRAAPDAIVLVKASRAVGLEHFAELMASTPRSRRS